MDCGDVAAIAHCKKMAEAHGNRTHPRGFSPRAPDLKSGRATSALSASAENSCMNKAFKNNTFLDNFHLFNRA